jgi:hypothetical protein
MANAMNPITISDNNESNVEQGQELKQPLWDIHVVVRKHEDEDDGNEDDEDYQDRDKEYLKDDYMPSINRQRGHGEKVSINEHLEEYR